MKLNIGNIRHNPDKYNDLKSFGYYAIWAKKKEIKILLSKLDFSFEELMKDIEQNDDYYLIYIGKTSRKLIDRIFSNHINGNVCCSTLRQSIASILFLGKNMKQEIEKEVNHFLDTLYIETHNELINDKYEEELINKYLRILNIKSNNHKLSAPIKKKLMDLRKLFISNYVRYT